MALAQTNEVARRLKEINPDISIEIVTLDTKGDQDQKSKLDRHGGKGGAFISEIREALIQKQVHAVMHSLKDMPGNEETLGFVIAAYLPRESPADVLLIRQDLSFDTFKEKQGAGFKVGTNAVRRAAYIHRLFPKAEVIHYRGAADTRVRKLDTNALQHLPDGGEVGPADVLVMAKSGLTRVNLLHRAVYEFPIEDMLPAVGQGIVALECMETDWNVRECLAHLDDPVSRSCALAEREVLWVLNGHCNSPIAGYATFVDATNILLMAEVISEKGDKLIKSVKTGLANRPREIGREVGFDLLKNGANEIIEGSR